MPAKKKQKIRVLEHLISYAENQFGNRVAGKSYRVRINAERVDDWKVEIKILVSIHIALTLVYNSDRSLSIAVCNNLTFPY